MESIESAKNRSIATKCRRNAASTNLVTPLPERTQIHLGGMPRVRLMSSKSESLLASTKSLART